MRGKNKMVMFRTKAKCHEPNKLYSRAHCVFVGEIDSVLTPMNTATILSKDLYHIQTKCVFRDLKSFLGGPRRLVGGPGQLGGKRRYGPYTACQLEMLMNLPPAAGDNKRVLEALQEGISGLRADISTRPVAGTMEVLDAL